MNTDTATTIAIQYSHTYSAFLQAAVAAVAPQPPAVRTHEVEYYTHTSNFDMTKHSLQQEREASWLASPEAH